MSKDLKLVGKVVVGLVGVGAVTSGVSALAGGGPTVTEQNLYGPGTTVISDPSTPGNRIASLILSTLILGGCVYLWTKKLS